MSKEQDKYDDTLEAVAQLAKESALKHGGHVPTLVVEGRNVSVIAPLLDLPPTHDARCLLMFAAGAGLRREGKIGDIKQVFFICEGWLSVANQNGTFDLPPSKDPNRVEVLLISRLIIQSHRHDLMVFEMIRDAEDRLCELRDFEPLGGKSDTHAASPLLDVFMEGFHVGKSKRPQ